MYGTPRDGGAGGSESAAQAQGPPGRSAGHAASSRDRRDRGAGDDRQRGRGDAARRDVPRAEGKAQAGFELSFAVTGGGRKVGGLRGRLQETCQGAGSATMTTVASMATWTVRGGKFAGRKKEVRAGTTVYTTLEGEFTSRIRASGSIRQVAYRGGKACDTYKVPFTAKRG